MRAALIARFSPVLGELLEMIFFPIALLMRRLVAGRAASPEEIKRFYRSAEWKRARYEALSRSVS